MENLTNTQFIKIESEPMTGVQMVLSTVYEALREKGYNPVNQIVGYIISEDPTYITNYNNSRAIISKIDRDELLRTLVEDFIQIDSKKKG